MISQVEWQWKVWKASFSWEKIPATQISQNCLISYRAGAWHYRIFPDFLKSPVSKWRIVRVKTRTKAFFFEEILINIPSENLPKLSKERMQYFSFPEAKLKEPTLSLFDEQVARTKDDYKFSTAKDPLFNSTGFCIVEDHCRQEHRCDCVCTESNLSYAGAKT